MSKLTIEKIHEIYEGIESVNKNSKIGFKLAYELGIVSNSAKFIIKSYEEQREELRAVLVEKQLKLKKEMNKAQNVHKNELEIELRELNEEFIKQLNQLSKIEEELSIPTINLSELQDKGISIKFFSALHDFIEDDIKND